MALGKRKRERQEVWISTADLPTSPGHPFYAKLNEVLAAAKFDDWLEERCRSCYHGKLGRPSIPPGVYFRMILVGYFEGIGSQRGIAWRCHDSRALGAFLGYAVQESTPDHSSMTNCHKRLPLEVHDDVFQFVLELAAEHGLLKGRTFGVDSTTLEANAAMKSIVRKDTGEDYQEYLRRLMLEEGFENPTAEEARRFDKNRKGKKVPNSEWESKTDPDAKIAKMKDGTTHLAYKAEHVVDLDTDLVVHAALEPADRADNDTLVDSALEARDRLDRAGLEPEVLEIVADKGYHAAATLELADAMDLRTYIPEPQRQDPWNWDNFTAEERRAVTLNGQRVKRAKSKALQKRRSEMVERSFAHVCETGGGRRCWLHGLEKVRKRYLIQTAARNLGVILRTRFGVGTARSLQGAWAGAIGLVSALLSFLWSLMKPPTGGSRPRRPFSRRNRPRFPPLAFGRHFAPASWG